MSVSSALESTYEPSTRTWHDRERLPSRKRSEEVAAVSKSPAKARHSSPVDTPSTAAEEHNPSSLTANAPAAHLPLLLFPHIVLWWAIIASTTTTLVKDPFMKQIIRSSLNRARMTPGPRRQNTPLPTVRSKEVWEADGDFVFQMEEMQFKLSKKEMFAESWFFIIGFELYEGMERFFPQVDGCPVYGCANVAGITAPEFERFLSALDDPTCLGEPPSFEAVTSILRIAHHFQFTAAFAWAVEHFEMMLPEDLGAVGPEKLPVGYAAEAVILSRKHRIPRVLKRAFYELLRADRVTGTGDEHDYVAALRLLPEEDIIRLRKARDRHLRDENFWYTIWAPPFVTPRRHIEILEPDSDDSDDDTDEGYESGITDESSDEDTGSDDETAENSDEDVDPGDSQGDTPGQGTDTDSNAETGENSDENDVSVLSPRMAPIPWRQPELGASYMAAWLRTHIDDPLVALETLLSAPWEGVSDRDIRWAERRGLDGCDGCEYCLEHVLQVREDWKAMKNMLWDRKLPMWLDL